MQVSGNMAVVYDRNAAAGSRGFRLDHGSAIDAGATYTVATNDFLARGVTATACSPAQTWCCRPTLRS